MKCNCNNSNNGGSVDDIKIKHVYGNVLRLAIPLTKRIVTVENEEVVYTDSDFIPSSEYPVTVEFSKGNIKISHQAIMHDGNVAYIEDDGTIPVGVYDITVLCKDDDGKPYRFKKKSVVDVSNYTIDADIEQPVEFESIVWYLDAAIYMALKGEDGVGIEDIITQSSSEIGGLNVITIVLTNGETKTFTILNGSGTVDNHFDENSPYPIANNVVTTKINAIDDYLSNLFGQVVYDSNSKNIFFYNKDRTKILATLDARPFIKDGMVSNAYISNNTLVITFNTDAGREAIAIPLSSVFNPNNYYNKSQTDNRISQALQDIVSNTVSANQLIGNKIIIGNAQISLRESNGNYMIEFGLITEGQQSVKTITLPFIQYRDSIAMHSDLDTLFSLVFGQVDYDSTNHRINFYAKNDESKTTPLGYIDSTPFEGGGSGGGDGTVTAIKMNNGTPIEPDSNGVVDLGTVITQHQDLSDFATTDDVDNAIAALVSSAPQTLDTLKELADALGDDPNFATTITTALGNKVDKESGKSLMTDAERTKLAGIAAGAEVNVNADWNAASGDAQILNKPNLAAVATSGSYNDLTDKPTIPASVTVDSTITQNGTSPVQGGAIYSALADKMQRVVINMEENNGVLTFTDADDNALAHAQVREILNNSHNYVFLNYDGKQLPKTQEGEDWWEFELINLTISTYVDLTWDTDEIVIDDSDTTNLNDYFVNMGRTINGKALSSNITLTASDVGAQSTISDLATIRSGAAAGATAVQPAAMNTALAGKQDTLTFDNAPTANSNNPVKSGGIKTYVDGKATITGITTNQDGTFTITQSDGNSFTVDLNHTHPQYLTEHQSLSGYAKFVLCQDETEYNAITNKDSGTLYLIPES